jgi:hypothetical protein
MKVRVNQANVANTLNSSPAWFKIRPRISFASVCRRWGEQGGGIETWCGRLKGINR